VKEGREEKRKEKEERKERRKKRKKKKGRKEGRKRKEIVRFSSKRKWTGLTSVRCGNEQVRKIIYHNKEYLIK
jgi:hypothetical protein